MGGEINSVYITDVDGEVIDNDKIIMRCADEDLIEREFSFLNDGSGGFVCKCCGWMQHSEAAGAAELCNSASWHDAKAYSRYAGVASEGGFHVPEALLFAPESSDS